MSAPIELVQLGLAAERFRKGGTQEYHGPCPFCGGKDRFIVWTDRDWPHWFWLCRKCGRDGWADELNPRLKEELTPELKAEYARSRRAAEQARDGERRSALERFSTREIWKEFHQRMTFENREWWNSQGIPADWQDFWKLGYLPEKIFEQDGQPFTRAAYTIPKFDLRWAPKNIDYRIVDPPPGVGKYRPAPGLPACAFLSLPFRKEIDDEVFIVEGSKKAMVLTCKKALPCKDYPFVIGLPGCASWAGVEERVKESGRVWVMLDPGAEDWAGKLARAVGRAARVVTLEMKPDDMVLAGAELRDFTARLRQARVP